jgi:PAP2 superfamily C-terminal
VEKAQAVTSTDSSRGSGSALLLRIFVTAVGIGAWYGTQSLIGSRPSPSGEIGDGLLTLTAPLNHYLAQHSGAANALLIVSSGFVDLLALFLFGEWVVGRSVRPLLGLAILLGLRQLMEALCALPAPPNIIWHYPGFPSLLVTYYVANDFFFSAHTSIAVLAATELARLRRRWLTILAMGVVVFEAVAVLSLRAHYTMDVFTAIVAALYVAHLSERLSPALDRRFAWLLSPVPSPPAGDGRPTRPSPVSAILE